MSLCDNPTGCVAWINYYYGNSTTKPVFTADPDIAGAGVDWAFVIIAVLTLSFALAHRILAMPQFAEKNPLDGLLYRALGRLACFDINQDRREFWVPILETVILNLSDQMLLTGLAMLVAVFTLHCDISVYHVTIVSDLVWFSSNVHLTTLVALRTYLREEPVLRTWRIVIMICMAGFLIALSWWQGHSAWYDSPPFPAQCLWNDMYEYPTAIGGKPKFWMVTDISLVAIFYTLTIVLMHDGAHNFLIGEPMRFLQSKIDETHNQENHQSRRNSTLISVRRLLHTLSLKPWIGPWIFDLGLVLLFDSACINYVVDLFWFAYSLYFLLQDRKIPAEKGATMDGDENAMGFGQIIPILLLGSTLFVCLESWSDQRKSAEEKESPKSQTSPSTTADSSVGQPDTTSPAVSPPQRVDTNTLDMMEMGRHTHAIGMKKRPRARPLSKHGV